VANSGEEHGHNVRGISPADTKLAKAPGSTWLQAGCGPSCHISLTLPDYDSVSEDYNNGCEGCHQSVRHHGDDPASQPVSPAGGWYRFLSAPIGHMLAVGGGGVYGIEHQNWEQGATASSHNIYFGGSIQPAEPNYYESMGTFCAGCHADFHAPGGAGFWVDNGGNGTPWLRHPTDVVIPNRGEYGNGKVLNTAYSPLVPVGKPDLASFNGSIIEEGDRVICMSCHRAHGSPYPDMLRWDYNGMLAHDPDGAAGTGCFKCHTTKDEV
jgi:predicted CXXCH cytochrome family protein